MRNYLIALVAILVFSCRQKENTTMLPTSMTDTIATEKDKIKDSLFNEQKYDTIKMLIQDEKGNYTAIGTIDSIHSKIYVKFTNPIAASLKAAIIPMDGDGNIRFNQILFPDGHSDGPFGKEIEQELKQTGEHTLIIGHSQMADGQYQGKFKVDLQLSEK